MHLEIVTPEKKVFEGEVTIVTFPGADGSFQVLDHHAPLISLLKGGIVEFKSRDMKQQVKITGGVVEVLHNTVVVLVDALAA